MTDRDEWLEWRKKGIGSSDAACVWGKSPYKTRHELGEEKRGKDIRESKTNWAMNKGNELEPIARQKLAALLNIENGTDETFDAKIVVMKDYPFMRASLDGCSKDGSVIAEFKFMGKEKHLAVLKGEIPEHYRIQVMHQLLVSGADYCWFASFDGETLHTHKIERDASFMVDHLELCKEFWSLVEQDKPQPISDDDFKTIRVKGATALAYGWKQIKRQIEELEAKEEEMRNELIKLADHPRCKIDDVRIISYPGNRGTIDYTKVMKLPEISSLGIDLEQFRKPNGKPYHKVEIK